MTVESATPFVEERRDPLTSSVGAAVLRRRPSGTKNDPNVISMAVDQAEFPFLVYAVIAGRQSCQKIKDGLAGMRGYAYSGSSTGSSGDGSTYFALNMMPNSAYPRSHAEAIRRRTMIRLQMLAAIWNDQ